MSDRRPVRLSRKPLTVLAAVAATSPGTPAGVVNIRERTGYSTEQVFWELHKLARARWIEVLSEDTPDGRWQSFRLTDAGRVRLEESLEAEAARAERGPLWRVLLWR